MKKFLALILCITAFSVVGCQKNDEGNSEKDSTDSGAYSVIESESAENSFEDGNLQTSTYTVVAEYDYGSHVENRLSILYGGCWLFFDIPEEHGEVIAGDSFLITYTGELTIYETHPSSVSVSGEIVSVTAKKAETVVLLCKVSEAGTSFFLYEDGEQGEEVKIANRPRYYLTNDNGEIGYEEVTTSADCKIFYGTYSPVNGYDETDGYTLSGLYAWNPREE